jgi:hypothetical protein
MLNLPEKSQAANARVMQTFENLVERARACLSSADGDRCHGDRGACACQRQVLPPQQLPSNVGSQPHRAGGECLRCSLLKDAENGSACHGNDHDRDAGKDEAAHMNLLEFSNQTRRAF